MFWCFLQIWQINALEQSHFRGCFEASVVTVPEIPILEKALSFAYQFVYEDNIVFNAWRVIRQVYIKFYHKFYFLAKSQRKNIFQITFFRMQKMEQIFHKSHFSAPKIHFYTLKIDHLQIRRGLVRFSKMVAYDWADRRARTIPSDSIS